MKKKNYLITQKKLKLKKREKEKEKLDEIENKLKEEKNY